ncbi:MAG: 50S ribosomal protein L20 [Candidatus Omnitrophica bacterium]|nr:50S ribosomal protein L20 [Candidatus Omnitrophota bacterium]
MARVKHRVASKKRRKKALKSAKGYVGGRSKLHRTAKETVLKAKAYATRDRKRKKRTYRSLWITRINAGCKVYGVKYSDFIDGLKKAKVSLDRKILAELAVSNKAAFKKLVDLIKPKNPTK